MAKSVIRLGLADLISDVTHQWRHLVAKRGNISGQLDIWSVFGSG